MIWLTLRRDTEWMIVNGPNALRWTRWFGANCMADTPDTMETMRSMHGNTPGSEIVRFEVRELDKASKLT